MKTKLTMRAVETAKAAAAPYEIRDSEIKGLLLRVQPSGVKSFYIVFRRGQRVSLGKYPVITVEAARTQALAQLGEFAKTKELPKAKTKVVTLRRFIEQEFRPWASVNLKSGDAASDRILAVFADFADRPLSAINAWTVEKIRSKRIKNGVSPNTCNRDIAALKSALSRARQWGMLIGDPLAEVKQAKVDSTRVRYLSESEEKRLREALVERDSAGQAARASGNDWRVARGKNVLPMLSVRDYIDHLHPAVLISLNTGLRRGELTALAWRDVSFEEKVVTVRAAAAKSGKMRRVPLNNEAIRVLKQWRKQRADDGRLFPFHDMKTAWHSLLANAKVESFRWHDMRHTFGSRLVMAGVDLNTVRELLGHADLKMTLRYAHLAPSHLADAVHLLGAR